MKKKLVTITANVCLILALVALSVASCAEVEPGPTPEPGPGPTPGPGPGPVTPPVEEPRYGGVLRIGSTEGLFSIGFPVAMREYNDVTKTAPALETLFRHDAEGNLVPWLALAWEEDPAGTTVTIPLRKGVKFHDGTDFNAEAAKWNLDQVLGVYGEAELSGLEFVESVDVIDDYTIQLNLTQYNNTFPLTLARWIIPKMISPTAYEIHGKDWCQNNAVGTGPFKFVSWEKDVLIKFERFDDYWQEGKPYLDGIEIVQIADPMVSIAAFAKGDIDCLLKPDPKDVVDLMATGKYKLDTVPGVVWQIAPDGANSYSPFADVRVRQALSYAIDKQAICDGLGYGFWQPLNQFSVPGRWGYDPDIVGQPYNPEKARELLVEAGYPDGFKCQLNFWHQMVILEQLMTACQRYLNEAGFTAELKMWDYAGYGTVFYKGWENGAAAGFMSVAIPDDLRNLYGSFKREVAGLASTYKPPAATEILYQAIVERDFETKAALTRQMQKILWQDEAVRTLLAAVEGLCIKYPEMHGDGLFDFAESMWTPESAWLSR